MYYCQLQTPNGTYMRVGVEWLHEENAKADADYMASNLPKGFVVYVYRRKDPEGPVRTLIYTVRGIL